MNWRKPLIQFIDTNLKGNCIHQNIALLRNFEMQALSMRLEMQEQRLHSLLAHAAQYVPYYRKQLLDAGVWNGRDVDLTAFRRIIPLDKNVLREHFDQLQSDDN